MAESTGHTLLRKILGRRHSSGNPLDQETKSDQITVARTWEMLLKDSRYSEYLNRLRSILSDDEARRYALGIPVAIDREIRLQSTYAIKEKPPGWLNTPVNEYDSENFQFILHALNYSQDFVASLKGDAIRKAAHEDGHVRTFQEFLGRNLISCTAVDEIHRGTYMQHNWGHGFILEVPPDNIVAIHPFDMGKPWDIQDEEDFRAHFKKDIDRRKATPSLHDFLAYGNVDRDYNEVVINGARPAGQMKVSGVWFVTNPFLDMPQYELDRRTSQRKQENFSAELFSKRLHEAKELSKLLNVPLVPILSNSVYPPLGWFAHTVLPALAKP